jgi:hypothetical protein
MIVDVRPITVRTILTQMTWSTELVTAGGTMAWRPAPSLGRVVDPG